ncbi:MAG: hypothetical protein M3Y30_14855, partial [Gemmatimonadota bacterium]|nr:hypothetical protein [Gemmatimonadota bacterium]
LSARTNAGVGVSGARAIQRWLRARYVGQGHELEISFAPGEAGAELATRFAAEHEKRMGFALDAEVEVIGARFAVSGAGREPMLAAPHFVDETRRGPDVIALSDATLFVADGWTARALPIGGWLMERGL